MFTQQGEMRKKEISLGRFHQHTWAAFFAQKMRGTVFGKWKQIWQKVCQFKLEI